MHNTSTERLFSFITTVVIFRNDSEIIPESFKFWSLLISLDEGSSYKINPLQIFTPN